jgi:hypothetical protein
MSYHQKQRAIAVRRPMGSVVSQPMGRRVSRFAPQLGSLGDDPTPPTTLSAPTIADPATAQWQDNVLVQLAAGVKTLQTAELQKWLQILATVSIPLSAAIWKMIFKRGVSDTGV